MTDRLNEIRERTERGTSGPRDAIYLLAEIDRLQRELLISEWAVDILNEQNGYKNP